MDEAQRHIQALHQILDDADIIRQADEMAPFCIDQRRRYTGHAWAVLQPRTVWQVQDVLRYCHANRIPVTPQGGNTSLCGGATPSKQLNGRGFILSMSKMNKLRYMNTADHTMTVEAGMILANAQQVAKENGYYFPLSLASEGSCQIGGNIACNAGGLNVVRYGTMRDMVMGLEYLLADGTLVNHLQPLHKNTTGYEPYHTIIGSEGTLAVITAATLKLFPQPQSSQIIWVGVDSIESAVKLLSTVQSHFGTRLSSFELISDRALQLSVEYSNLAAPTQANWHTLIELSDCLPGIDWTEQLTEVLSEGGWENAVLAQSDTDGGNLWLLRENISAAQRKRGANIKHDLALPIVTIADFVDTCEKAILKVFPQAEVVVFGHLGDGSLHYNVSLPEIVDNTVYEYEERINNIVYTQVLLHGGTIAAEHGIGQLKNQWLPRVRSEAEVNWMVAQKRHFDPHNLLNPGKVLPHSVWPADGSAD